MWLYFYKDKKIYDLQVRIWLFVREWESAWPVNMTGEWSFWPVKIPLWPDVTCWAAVILSPGNVPYCMETLESLVDEILKHYQRNKPSHITSTRCHLFVNLFVRLLSLFELIFAPSCVKRLPLSTFLFPRFRLSSRRANSILIKEPGLRSLLGGVRGLPYKSLTILA